jgi:hypothetical protein
MFLSFVIALFDVKDTDPKKVSLGVGAYRDDKGKVGRMQGRSPPCSFHGGDKGWG